MPAMELGEGIGGGATAGAPGLAEILQLGDGGFGEEAAAKEGGCEYRHTGGKLGLSRKACKGLEKV